MGESIEVKVLLVESFDVVQDVCRSMFENRCYGLDIAGDGQAGVEEYIAAHERGDPYDVVVMGVKLPVMYGDKVYEAIRNYEEEHGKEAVPVLIISGTGIKYIDEVSGLKEAVRDRDDVEFLMKPFGPDKLYERLDLLLD